MQILKLLNTTKPPLNNINLHQSTKNYQICISFFFFAGQLLLVTKRIVSFFDLVCPATNARISQELKKPFQNIKLHMCTKNHDIYMFCWTVFTGDGRTEQGHHHRQAN